MDIFDFREKRIIKKGLFHRVNELFKSNQTLHGVAPLKAKCRTKNFAIACLGKELVFHTKIFEFRENRILKIGLFHRVKKLCKSNQPNLAWSIPSVGRV